MTDIGGTMKRLTVAVFVAAVLVVSTPTPAEAHTIACASYVGNEACFARSYWHNWWHQVLSNPLGVLR